MIGTILWLGCMPCMMVVLKRNSKSFMKISLKGVSTERNICLNLCHKRPGFDSLLMRCFVPTWDHRIPRPGSLQKHRKQSQPEKKSPKRLDIINKNLNKEN